MAQPKVDLRRPSGSYSTGYRIDPSLRAFLPPLLDSERSDLKRSLRAEGRCLDPLVVWAEERVLVDGHHRHQLIRELADEGVEISKPQIVHKSFRDRFQVIRWMIEFQNARRNWTPAQRAAAVLRNQDLIEKLRGEARTRMRRGKKMDPKAHAPKGSTRQFLARLAGVGEGTISAVQRVLESGEAEIIDKLLVARKLSVREAKWAVAKAQRLARLRERAGRASQQLPPPDSRGSSIVNKIVLADVLGGLAAVDPNSVALAFTSPPYPLASVRYPNFEYGGNYEKYLDWLKEVWRAVAKTLRHGGRLVVNCDATANCDPDSAHADLLRPMFANIVNQMRDLGLLFLAEICWFRQHVARSRPRSGTYGSCRSPRMRRNHEFLLVFGNGSGILEGDPNLCDLTPEEYDRWTIAHWQLQPQRKRFDGHPAAFPEALAERVIRLFSYVGDTVLDPFCGSGTVPAVAKRFGRRFIGIDNAESYVTAARARVDAIAAE